MKRSTSEAVKKAILENVASVLDQLDAEYETATEKAGEAYGSAKERVTQVYQSAREKAAESREKADDYIKGNPEKSILLAAGVGALVALVASALISRRRD